MSFSSSLFFGSCLLVSFLYAGIEGGLLSLNRVRLRSRVHQGERGAVRLARLLAHPGRLLATVLLVTNFADVAALVLVTDTFVHACGTRGYVWAGALMLPVYLLGLQLLPKSLFRRFPYRALVTLAGLLEGTERVLAPLLATGRWLLGRTLLAPLPAMNPAARGLSAARDEFKALAAEGERTGALTPSEHRMIDNVIDFSTLTAERLMDPATPETFRLPPGAGADGAGPRVADLLEFARTRSLDYLPVMDAAGGLIALLDVFALLLERDLRRDAAVYLRRPPLVVAPGDAALHVLRRLRAVRLGAAAVRDEAGRFVGIVRTSTLLQRLVRQKGA